MEEGSEQGISHRASRAHVWVWSEFWLTRGIVRAVGTVTDVKVQDSQSQSAPLSVWGGEGNRAHFIERKQNLGPGNLRAPSCGQGPGSMELTQTRARWRTQLRKKKNVKTPALKPWPLPEA